MLQLSLCRASALSVKDLSRCIKMGAIYIKGNATKTSRRIHRDLNRSFLTAATQSFLQRLKNLAFYCGSLVGEQLRALPLYTRLGRIHGVDCLAVPVAHGSAMFLYNMDFAMEWPRPLPPNVQLVGALLPAAAKPLPPAFQVSCLCLALPFLSGISLQDYPDHGRLLFLLSGMRRMLFTGRTTTNVQEVLRLLAEAGSSRRVSQRTLSAGKRIADCV